MPSGDLAHMKAPDVTECKNVWTDSIIISTLKSSGKLQIKSTDIYYKVRPASYNTLAHRC